MDPRCIYCSPKTYSHLLQYCKYYGSAFLPQDKEEYSDPNCAIANKQRFIRIFVNFKLKLKTHYSFKCLCLGLRGSKSEYS